jgi:hypothetical protein
MECALEFVRRQVHQHIANIAHYGGNAWEMDRGPYIPMRE